MNRALMRFNFSSTCLSSRVIVIAGCSLFGTQPLSLSANQTRPRSSSPNQICGTKLPTVGRTMGRSLKPVALSQRMPWRSGRRTETS